MPIVNCEDGYAPLCGVPSELVCVGSVWRRESKSEA